MKVRGRRECKACGTRWSYYDTGEVACPSCGSLRSVGVDDERRRHTDAAVTLDLSEFRESISASDVDGATLDELGPDLKSTLRSYVRRRGFIDGGDLRPLDDAVLAARELLHAVDLVSRSRRPTDDERLYLLSLLRGADRGERPAVEEVPASLRAARGLAVAEAVEDYRADLRTWLADHPDPEARKTLGTIGEQQKRIEALQGEVAPEEADALVAATREIWTHLADDDEDALGRARDRLSRLA
jgi:uncharacterized Zn finger protein (UPF0148 family)